jgi:hypothetical protein
MKNLAYTAAVTLVTSIAIGSVPSRAADDDEWEFMVAPMYLWGKSIGGSASAGGNALPLDLEFKDDILENLEAAFAVHFEAKKGNLGLFFEYNYAHLDPSSEVPGLPFDVKTDVDFKDTMIEGGVTWAFAQTNSTRWEVLGGVRYYDQDVVAKISSSVPVPLPSKVSTGDSWAQPFAGIRATTKLSERWSLRFRGDYGYEHSDNTALHGLFMFDYRFRGWGSVFAGYRYVDIEYDNGSSRTDQYGFDGDQQGPIIGLNLYF